MVDAEPNLPEKFMPSLVLSYVPIYDEDEPNAFDQTPLLPPSGTRQPAGHGSYIDFVLSDVVQRVLSVDDVPVEYQS